MDNEVLSQLPKDGTIISSIETHDIEPTRSNANIGAKVNTNTTKANTNDKDPSPIVTTISNLHLEFQELEQLR